MSPAFLGSTQTRVPSFTCQPGLMPSLLKLCQPARSLPLKSNSHPAAFSRAVRVLGSEELECRGCLLTHPVTPTTSNSAEATSLCLIIILCDRLSVDRS